MGDAIRPLYMRIGLVFDFDFDGTLTADSYSALIEHCGMDPAAFAREQIRPLREAGWEEIPAKFYALIRVSRQSQGQAKITRDRIEAFARQLQPLEGVQATFDELRDRVRQLDPGMAVEGLYKQIALRALSRGG